MIYITRVWYYTDGKNVFLFVVDVGQMYYSILYPVKVLTSIYMYN